MATTSGLPFATRVCVLPGIDQSWQSSSGSGAQGAASEAEFDAMRSSPD
jgi:hypothetical protein